MTIQYKNFASKYRPRPVRRSKTAGMNKLESEYNEKLMLRRMSGEDITWYYERHGFKLTDKCFYYPDFVVYCPDCIEIHECKGYWEDDALVKWKCFIEIFPHFKFFTAQKKSGLWEIKEW